MSAKRFFNQFIKRFPSSSRGIVRSFLFSKSDGSLAFFKISFLPDLIIFSGSRMWRMGVKTSWPMYLPSYSVKREMRRRTPSSSITTFGKPAPLAYCSMGIIAGAIPYSSFAALRFARVSFLKSSVLSSTLVNKKLL